MKARWIPLVAVLCGSLAGFVYADPAPTGLFGLPYNEYQTWPACNSSGWVPYGDPYSHQYHMQLNEELSTPKYHMGEDWNGKCGANTDEDAPLLAIAGGQVMFLDDSPNGVVDGQGKRLYIRHSFPYAPAPNDVTTFDSVFLHLKCMEPGIFEGSTVTKGQTVARLGKTGTIFAHLHWEAQLDLTLQKGRNPYEPPPLTINHALKYRAPSLIVDDRRDLRGYSVPADGRWYYFIMQGNAPSSTMYIMRNGQRKSLKNAIAAGWIPSQGIRHEINGSWYYYTDVDINFFENGKKYAINALVSGISQYILIPRNGFQEDRARLDILHAVEHNTGYVSVKTETYGHDPNWTSDFELHQMKFQLSTNQTVYVYQATYKTNPLISFTNHYDTATKQPTGWVPIDWNRLY